MMIATAPPAAMPAIAPVPSVGLPLELLLELEVSAVTVCAWPPSGSVDSDVGGGVLELLDDGVVDCDIPNQISKEGVMAYLRC